MEIAINYLLQANGTAFDDVRFYQYIRLYYTIHMYSGITSGEVLNGSFYTQRF